MPDLPGFAKWLIDLLLYIPKKIYEMLTDMLVSMIDYIFSMCSVCNFSNINTSLTGMTQGVIWMLGWFRFDYGLSVVLGAYVIRFLIRRLPIVG